jgi:hypothetical protein
MAVEASTNAASDAVMPPRMNFFMLSLSYS